MTNKRIYFQPNQLVYITPVIYYNITSIKKLYKRRYKQMRIGLEFTTIENKMLYVAF